MFNAFKNTAEQLPQAENQIEKISYEDAKAELKDAIRIYRTDCNAYLGSRSMAGGPTGANQGEPGHRDGDIIMLSKKRVELAYKKFLESGLENGKSEELVNSDYVNLFLDAYSAEIAANQEFSEKEEKRYYREAWDLIGKKISEY